MRHLINLFAKLYPAWWRDRYGAEFGALLDDTGATAQAACNILLGALLMRFRSRKVHWLPTLNKSWWLLALCGTLDAMLSVMNFFMRRPDGTLTLRTFVNSRSTIVHMGVLALIAGWCTVAAGIWNIKKGQSWLLVLNGLTYSTLGLIFTFWTGRLAFHTIAFLIVVMAMSLGTYELATARMLQGHFAKEWRLGTAAAISVAFALAFLAFLFGWLKLEPGAPAQSLLWLGSYFGFSAICMLDLAFRDRKVYRLSC